MKRYPSSFGANAATASTYNAKQVFIITMVASENYFGYFFAMVDNMLKLKHTILTVP